MEVLTTFNYKCWREIHLSRLSDYKRNFLGITECGEWNNRSYSHILPLKNKFENIIGSDYKNEIIEIINNENIELNDHFHHLNSSQALGFNLFFPFCIDQKLEYIHTINNDGYAFEKKLCPKEKTQLDFLLKANRQKWYVEIKYSEPTSKITNKINDDYWVKKYNTYYKYDLYKYFKINVEIYDFYSYYQIFRNLLYGCKDNYLNIFVFPKSRLDWSETIKFIKEKYCINLKNQIKILYIDTFVEAMLQSKDEKILRHYTLFYEKYMKNEELPAAANGRAARRAIFDKCRLDLTDSKFDRDEANDYD